jgi:AcrR family transcriptional regulator
MAALAGRRSRSTGSSSDGVFARDGAKLFDREQVAEIQRARILSAMFDVVSERGASNVSVAHVVQRSGVSRRTFYEAFTDRDECFRAAFEQALALACERVVPAYQTGKVWRERVRAGLAAFLAFLDEQPQAGRLLVCESLAGDRRVLERRNQVIAQVTRVIEHGGKETRAGSVPPLAAEGVVGGVLTVLHSRLTAADRAPLVELTNPLMSMIVLPYLGSAAARRELDRPVPMPVSSAVSGATLLSDPFKDAGMRLTYRSVRVLMAIAELGGRGSDPSNRVIADTAEITDQGQISKLLGRLERIGLVTNSGLGPGQGAPNAWTLTASGRHVVNSIRTHTTNEGSVS